MEYKNFCEALASYQTPNFTYEESGKIDIEQTAPYVLGSIATFCNRIKTINHLEDLTRVVCEYSLKAKEPGQSMTAERAAEALAEVIELNDQIMSFGEVIEAMAQTDIIYNRKK